jgi:hypothetical protein
VLWESSQESSDEPTREETGSMDRAFHPAHQTDTWAHAAIRVAR